MEKNVIENQEVESEVVESTENDTIDDNVDFNENEEVEKVEKKQSKAQNSWYANQRRALEEEKKRLREEIRKEETLKAIKNVNPYTNEKIESDADYKLFLEMRTMEEKGYNPIEDSIKYKHDLLKEDEKKIKLQQQENQKAIDDINQFKSEYPDVNFEDLKNDKNWVMYTYGKLGSVSLTEMYKNYTEMKQSMEQDVVSKQQRKLEEEKAREISSASLSGSVETQEDYFSLEEMKKITPRDLANNPSLYKKYDLSVRYYAKNKKK